MKSTIIKHQCAMWALRTGQATCAFKRPDGSVSFQAAGWPIKGSFICEAKCDHKFVDSTRCLKCGWLPPAPEAAPR